MKTLLNDREIEYQIKKSVRARRLRVTVHCDARVIVTAPFYFSDFRACPELNRRAERFLKEKANWVLSKIDYFLRSRKILRISGGKREYKKRREQAREFIFKKVESINKIYNFSFKKISIKNQKIRWGSCSKKGNLNFNYKIIFLPERLAEYIIAHELCHLREFNHSRNFWNLLSAAVPEYRECRRELRKGIILK